ncbi:MAG: hypothetical protein COA51_00190 [Idiomarina sp.]|nr:MAG: hypothetical protein COA51_00190 [Idiomarina sp.]
MTNRFKRQILLSLGVLALGLLAIVVYSQLVKSNTTKNRNDLYQELLERSGKLNRDLPRLLDKQTRFERAEVVNYGMRFIYSLVDVDKYQHNVDEIRQQIEPAMQQQYCASEMLTYYREHAEFLLIRYLDRSEALLFELRFTGDQCAT